MITRLVVLILIFVPSFFLGQTVNIYVYSQALVVPAAAHYSPFFGAGNVNVTNGPATADYSLYDIVIFSCINQNFTAANVTDLVTYVQNGGHVVLSTEGSNVTGGGKLMSMVWNSLTGQAITETNAGASGTVTPPRFHNSNGPWHLSPDPNLTGSTTSYASFANLSPINVTHQRNLGMPTCGNIEGLSAVHPARPNMGEGTLYIQGEVQYPYSNFLNSPEVSAHAEAIANMHYALISNNQPLLNQLNTWEANLVVDDTFIGNDTVFCANDFEPFTKTSPVYQSYSWETPSGQVLSTNQSYLIADSGSYIIKTVGAFPQCDGIDTINVVFNGSPKASFSADTVCLGSETSFTEAVEIVGGVIDSRIWDFGDGNTSADVSPNHEYLTSGNFNVQLSVLSAEGCSHDTTISVVVNAQPEAEFTVSSDCIYEPVIFTESSAVSTGMIASWKWNFGDGQPLPVVESTDQLPSHTFTTSGSFDVTLIVETDKGCSAMLTQSTTRYPAPEVSFTTIAACKNDSVNFQNTSSIAAPDNITSWIWNFGDGSPLVDQFERKHKYINDGFYNATLIASSNNGCVSDVTNFVQVYPLPVASFTASNSCENGDATQFFNTSTIAQGFITDFEWDFNDDGATSTNQFAEYNYSSAGTYNVELNVNTNNGCKDTVEGSVTIFPKPEANFIADTKEGCYPYCTSFTDNSVSNATSITNYFWIFGNGEVSTLDNPTVCFENLSHTEDALYDATLIVTNNEGCKDTIIQNNYITVWPKPNAVFDVNPSETNMYESIITFINLSEGGNNYFWDYNDGGVSSVFEEEHNYRDTGSYVPVLIAETIHGCRDTTENRIKINPVFNLYIPNAFTPNGDGNNDTFFISGFAIDFDNNFQFSIFDRWGEEVYRTDGNFPWDGTFKGEQAPQDSYFYQVRLKTPAGKDEIYRGNFMLIR